MGAKSCAFKTSVGGQALMEGVMMKGPTMMAAAVRKPDGTLEVRTEPVKKHAWQKVPVVRGVLAMVDSFVTGYRYLTLSAELSMTEEDEEEPGPIDRWLQKHLGEKGMQAVVAVTALLGVALAVLLFVLLPTAAVALLGRLVPLGGFKTLLESLLKAAVLIGYLAAVSRMQEIRRVFSYHGAEHKTISCYEAGEALTVENVRRHSRFHPRCGTSFILIVLIIGFVISSLLPWGSALVRMGLKLLVLPVVVGLAYEIIKLAGRYDNIITRIVSAPGLWLQRLTTNEPDDSMIETAIAAVTPVLPENREDGRW